MAPFGSSKPAGTNRKRYAASIVMEAVLSQGSGIAPLSFL
jgi:hypothetical protein